MLAVDVHMTKDLRKGHRSRLKQKFMIAPHALADYELLELLLFYVFLRKDTKNIAKQLIEQNKSLNKTIFAQREELDKIPGIGNSTIALFKLVQEIFRRISLEKFADRPLIQNDIDVMEYYRTTLAHTTQEKLFVLFLDSNSRLIKEECMQEGTVNSIVIHSERIIQKALNCGARGIILVHNHPSGNIVPSREDINTTRELKKLCKALNISLLDHFLVGKNGALSFANKRYL